MPWSYPDNVPAVAENWTADEQRQCVAAANAVLDETGDDEQAIFACIHAAGKEEKQMNQKTISGPVTFKADSDKTGEFKAVFCTFDVIDKDGDVTLPRAFTEGAKVRIAYWGHRWGDLPVGRGEIHSDDKEAWVDGQFFMDTEGGRETYQTVKNLGELQEWSYSLDPIDAERGEFDGQDVQFLKKLEVPEVSPVMLGAGVDTRTVAIKGMKSAIGSHDTATTDSAWDGPDNETRVRSGESLDYYRKIYAWRDPEGDPAVKSTYKFIHHMVGAGGDPGAANTRACVAGIASLNGARTPTTIPDADRRGVWNHLASHLRDADIEPPELKALKVGARHTGKEMEAIQQIHDLVCSLGAKCEDADDDEGEPKAKTQAGKASGKPSTFAERIAIELLELP